MKIKVCGMREPENIRRLLELSPDYIGFIFYKASKRFVGAEDLVDVPNEAQKTGVFVNDSFEEIKKKVDRHQLNAVQLHGNESPELCRQLKQEGVEVIKAFGVDEQFNFEILSDYEDAVDFFLFDTKTTEHGGSGRTFDWGILAKYKLNTPYFLSGGLDVENLQQVKEIQDKRLYAVDLNSRFETKPGLKDIKKVKKAFDLIRN